MNHFQVCVSDPQLWHQTLFCISVYLLGVKKKKVNIKIRSRTMLDTGHRGGRSSFYGSDYNPGRVATPTEEVRAGICNSFMVPAIARILFAKYAWWRGIVNIHQLMLAGRTSSLTANRGTHTACETLMNHPACETPGWQFIAGLGFRWG